MINFRQGSSTTTARAGRGATLRLRCMPKLLAWPWIVDDDHAALWLTTMAESLFGGGLDAAAGRRGLNAQYADVAT